MPRPLPVSLWYPSDISTPEVAPMTVLNYLEILKEEEEWEHLPNEQILNWFYYPNTPENRRHLQEKTTAFPELEPASGKFPVIVYAPSYEASSIENFSLCAYLASHGYVVIASPSRGTDNRSFEGGSSKDLETQARDLEFLIGESLRLPYADPQLIATMGFSFGGLSNVLAQMRNDAIKAIVSLDGSIKYQYKTLKSSPFARIESVDVPFIHFAQKDIPEQVLLEDKIDPALNYRFEFYDSLRYSNAYSLKFHHLTHSYFSTLGVLFQPRDPRQDKSDPEIAASYRWVSRYTLNFLNAYLKEEQSAINFMKNTPEENGAAEKIISLRSKKPEAQPFTFQDFNELAARQGYQNLEELYRSVLQQHPTLEIPEGRLNNLGLQLVFDPTRSDTGIAILTLATVIYPQSANLFDSLAEGHFHRGEKEKAIRYFERSLALDGGNRNAVERLRVLKK